MTDRLRDAFRTQAGACADLGSPFMARMCTLFADRLMPGSALTDRLFGWPGDLTPRAASVPLRLAGALHALRLQGHAGLVAVYPPRATSDDALWSAVAGALDTDTDFINRWIDSPPQTNEVRRAAVLIGIGHWLTARFGLPLRLSELGASGGLNLQWDHFAMRAQGQRFGPANAALTLAPDWRGTLPPASTPIVAERRGVDINPLDPAKPEDRLRLLAYLWADQPERIALTDAAIGVSPGAPDKGDAVDWLARRLDPQEGQSHLIYSTVAWQYFPDAAQARGTELIEAAGAAATLRSPLAWFGMETDGQGPGAALTLRLWPGDVTIPLGRADFHGRWVDWSAPDPMFKGSP